MDGHLTIRGMATIRSFWHHFSLHNIKNIPIGENIPIWGKSNKRVH